MIPFAERFHLSLVAFKVSVANYFTFLRVRLCMHGVIVLLVFDGKFKAAVAYFKKTIF